MGNSRRGKLFTDTTVAAASPHAAARPRACVRCLNLSGSALTDKGPRYRMLRPPVAAKTVPKLDLIILGELSLADTMPDEGDLLVAMLAAVAFGITLVDKRTWQTAADPFVSEACVRHVPSLEKVPVTVVLSEAFAQKHGRYTKVLEAASASQRSKWHVKAEAGADGTVHRIGCANDVAAFIRRMRRVLRTSEKIAGTLFPSAAAPPTSGSILHADPVPAGVKRKLSLRALFS